MCHWLLTLRTRRTLLSHWTNLINIILSFIAKGIRSKRKKSTQLYHLKFVEGLGTVSWQRRMEPPAKALSSTQMICGDMLRQNSTRVDEETEPWAFRTVWSLVVALNALIVSIRRIKVSTPNYAKVPQSMLFYAKGTPIASQITPTYDKCMPSICHNQPYYLLTSSSLSEAVGVLGAN